MQSATSAPPPPPKAAAPPLLGSQFQHYQQNQVPYPSQGGQQHQAILVAPALNPKQICAAGGMHMMQDEFTCCGIALAILCFPIVSCD